jgi:TPR repeat protein
MADQIMKRIEANDAASIYLLANSYDNGTNGFQEDHAKRAADLGHSKAHSCLGDIYRDRGDLKKAKFHLEAAAMVGHEAARYRLGEMDLTNYEVERL